MFERYTDKARRVIFFARYEASECGSHSIEAEHLLLGLLREDHRLARRFLKTDTSLESVRERIKSVAPAGKKVPTSVDLPLGEKSKHVLRFAAEEADRLSHEDIGTKHLLLGLLREEESLAAEILRDGGLRLPDLREEFERAAEIGKAHAIVKVTDVREVDAQGKPASETADLAEAPRAAGRVRSLWASEIESQAAQLATNAKTVTELVRQLDGAEALLAERTERVEASENEIRDAIENLLERMDRLIRRLEENLRGGT
jgi:ATP-dependent Clp protease ATP-binding subunit ClpA